MQVTGATCSLLFELHPALRQMQATSGAGLEHLPTKPWDPTGEEARLARLLGVMKSVERVEFIRFSSAAYTRSSL